MDSQLTGIARCPIGSSTSPLAPGSLVCESSPEDMRRVILMFSFMAVIGTACSGGSGHASPTTSTTLGPNPDIVPQVITADYVNAVFKVLNHLDGDVTRSLVADVKVTPQDDSILRAIYNDPLYSEEVKIEQETLNAGTSNARKPPGDRSTTVLQLLDISPRCIFVSTRSDYSQVVIHVGHPTASEYWTLKPKQAQDDPGGLNPTPWAFGFNASYLTPTTIPDQCNVG